MEKSMLKKYCLFLFMLAFTLGTVSARAITILNDNKYSVKYQIADASTCVLNYNEGSIGTGGQVTWIQSVLIHPSSVCVHASGVSSTVGAYARNLKNDNCVVAVKDAGFMRGIKIEVLGGC